MVTGGAAAASSSSSTDASSSSSNTAPPVPPGDAAASGEDGGDMKREGEVPIPFRVRVGGGGRRGLAGTHLTCIGCCGYWCIRWIWLDGESEGGWGRWKENKEGGRAPTSEHSPRYIYYSLYPLSPFPSYCGIDMSAQARDGWYTFNESRLEEVMAAKAWSQECVDGQGKGGREGGREGGEAGRHMADAT